MSKSIWDVRVAQQGLDHPEGLNFGLDGSLYAGGEAGQIYRIDISRNTCDVIANTKGFILGVISDADDRVYACDCANHCVYRVSRGGEIREFVRNIEGDNSPLNFPNYGLFDDKGNYYVTDSGEYWRTTGRLLRVSPDGVVRSLLGSLLGFPNGLALSSDGRTLFMAESTAQRVVSIPLETDGTLGAPEIYAQLPGSVPDGLSLDELGNLYVSCYTPEILFKIDTKRAVEVLLSDPTAEILNRPTNTAFRPGSSELYISNFGSSNISALTVGVPGLNLRYPRF